MVFYIAKKKDLHFHLLSNFPTFVKKIRVFSKKKKRSSIPFALKFPNFCQKIRVFSKNKVLSLLCH